MKLSKQAREFLAILASWNKEGALEGTHGPGLKGILERFSNKPHASTEGVSHIPQSGATLDGYKVKRKGRRVESDS